MNKINHAKGDKHHWHKHGRSKTPEHNVWQAIKRRCYLKTDRSYKDYGAKGVVMCDAWLDDFSKFFEDVGQRPPGDFVLSRHGDKGDYEPGNVSWKSREDNGKEVNKLHSISDNPGRGIEKRASGSFRAKIKFKGKSYHSPSVPTFEEACLERLKLEQTHWR